MACALKPDITLSSLTMGGTASEMEEATAIGEEMSGNLFNQYTWCDCPCDSLVSPERPSMLVMSLSYVCTSLVTLIVGMNLAFSDTNRKVWKKTFSATFSGRGSTNKSGGGSKKSGSVNPESFQSSYVESEVGNENESSVANKVSPYVDHYAGH